MTETNIGKILKDKNINELSRQSGIPANTIRGWKSGRHKPSRKNLDMLKNFLYPKGCSFHAVDK